MREGRKKRTIKTVKSTLVIVLHKHIPLSECEVGDPLSHRRVDPLKPLLARASNDTKVIVVFKGKYFLCILTSRCTLTHLVLFQRMSYMSKY